MVEVSSVRSSAPHPLTILPRWSVGVWTMRWWRCGRWLRRKWTASSLAAATKLYSQNALWHTPSVTTKKHNCIEGICHSIYVQTRVLNPCVQGRFVRLIKNSKLPADRKSPAYNIAIRQLHAAILGVCALVDSYPYTIERWMPELLTNVLAEHTYDPVSRASPWKRQQGSHPLQIPISTTVRKCASTFRKTHQDTWHEDSKKFTEDQLAALSTLLSGSSYCAYRGLRPALYALTRPLSQMLNILDGGSDRHLHNSSMP